MAGERMTEVAESPFMRRAARAANVFANVESDRVDAARAIVDESNPLATAQSARRVAAALLFKDLLHAERLRDALERAGMMR